MTRVPASSLHGGIYFFTSAASSWASDTGWGVALVISSQKLKGSSCQSPSQPSAKSAHISKGLSLRLNAGRRLS